MDKIVVYDYDEIRGREGHLVEQLRGYDFTNKEDVYIYADKHNKNYPHWEDIVLAAKKNIVVTIEEDSLKTKVGKGGKRYANCDKKPQIHGLENSPSKVADIKSEIAQAKIQAKLPPPKNTFNDLF